MTKGNKSSSWVRRGWAAWAVLGVGSLALLAWAYLGTPPAVGGESPDRVGRFLQTLGWRLGTTWVIAGLALRFVPRISPDAFFDRFVGMASPRAVAVARVVVCGVLLATALWEDLPSAALLPEVMQRPRGVMKLLALMNMAWTRDPASLATLQGLTVVLLALSLVGFATRVTVPLAAIVYLVFGGLLREYSKFFHTGIVAWYLLVVLAFGRSGEAFSVDAWIARRRGRPFDRSPTVQHGWTRYTLLLALVLAYVAAGLSKLVNSGLLWWNATRMRNILYTDSLEPMEFDFDLGLALSGAPDLFFAAMGFAAVFGEVGMAWAIFSRRGRLAMPALMIGMHLGILLTQNILFFDLIALLTLPYLWWMLEREGSAPAASTTVSDRRPPRSTLAITGALILAWSIGLELYPLTAMQMYSRHRDDGVVVYHRVLSISESGESREIRPEEYFGVLRDTRWRGTVRRCFTTKERDRARCEGFLETLGDHVGRATGAPPAAIEVRRYEWDFLEAPDDPGHGAVVERHVHRLGASDG